MKTIFYDAGPVAQGHVKVVVYYFALQTFRRSLTLHASPGDDVSSAWLRNSRRPLVVGLTVQTVLSMRQSRTAHLSISRVPETFPRCPLR